MQKAVIVTGGAGFIGCALSAQLRAFGLPIVAVDNLHPQIHAESRRPDALDADVELIVGDGHVDLYLRQEIDHVLSATVQLGMALLATEALDLGNRDALDANLGQRLAHVVQLERLDDGSD